MNHYIYSVIGIYICISRINKLDNRNSNNNHYIETKNFEKRKLIAHTFISFKKLIFQKNIQFFFHLNEKQFLKILSSNSNLCIENSINISFV